jgi:hypothetical protein
MKLKARASTRGEYAVLGLLTLLALALRLYKLEEWSYFIDELRSWQSTLTIYSKPLTAFFRPSLDSFWLIMKLSFDTFGVSAISMRLFPFIFGVVTIPLLYFPIKKVLDERVALLTVFMLAISPWHIYMSQMARWYTLLILLMFFALISFYNFIESGKLKYFILYAGLFYLAFAIHLTGGFVPMIAGTYVLLLLAIPQCQNGNINSRRLLILLAIHVGLSLVLLPKLINFISEWTTVEAELSGSFGSDFVLKFVYHATPSVAVMAFVGVVLLLKRYDRRGLFLAVYGLTPLLALMLARKIDMNVSARYLLFILPAVLAAASYACVYFKDQLRSNPNILTSALILVTILPSLQGGYLYFTAEYGYRDRLREAIKFVHSNMSVSDNDQIFCIPATFTPIETEFYCKAIARVEKMDLIEERFIAPSSTANLDLEKRIWLVTLGRLPQNHQGFWKWVSQNAQLLAEFEARRGTEDLTTKVYIYSPKKELAIDNTNPV